MTYVIRMTNAKYPNGLYIRAFDDLEIAQKYADIMIGGLDEYRRSRIVDTHSLYAHADHTTRVFVSNE